MRRVWKAACMELGSEWNWGGRVEFAKRVNWANTIQPHLFPFSIQPDSAPSSFACGPL